MHRLYGLFARSFGETKHRAVTGIKPIGVIVDSMLVLDRDVEAVCVGQLLGRNSRGVVAIYEHRHVA